MAWNPLYAFVASYRRIVVEHQGPLWSHLSFVVLITVVVVAVSEIMFRHLASAMVDEL